MALNCSHRHVFPETTNGEGYGRSWHMSQGESEEWHFNSRSDRVHHWSSTESHCRDIVDLLPSDPFKMDTESTFTAITGWLEDLEVGYGGYVRGNNGGDRQEDYGLFGGWNWIWNNSFNFQPFPGNFQFVANLNVGIQSFPGHFPVYEEPRVGNVNQPGEETDIGGTLAPHDLGFQPSCSNQGTMGFVNESTSCCSELHFGEKVEVATESEGPHEALAFSLSYLGVKDLLSVERVCRSLCSAVRGDPLLWRSIHIDHPLNERITDDLLLQLACRAQGNLQCLSLVRCPRVTDDGIRRILEINTRLTKLFVPGSTRLTIEGILSNMKSHNSRKDVPGIKQLRIGGISGVTREYFEELQLLLLGSDCKNMASSHKPHFYHRGNFYLPYDDDRAMDIEICPRCENCRLVYDCPAEGCQVKDNASPVCRACTICIPRCAQCGRCINDNEYEETFCLDWLCLDCFEQPPRYLERSTDEKVDSCVYEPRYDLRSHQA